MNEPKPQPVPAETDNPNTDAIEVGAAPMKIGPFTVKPFTLQTLIVLEAVNSPLVTPVAIDENGNAVQRGFGIGDIADALWVFINWDRPDILLVIQDAARFRREVSNFSATLRMADFPAIQRDLARVFDAIGKSMKDAGLAGEGGEKKGGTGLSE